VGLLGKEKLENYELGYLVRMVVEGKLPAEKAEKSLEMKFVDYCVGCEQGIPSKDFVYKKGRPFHADCFAKMGNNFQTPNQELLKESADTKVQLVYLKNLKIRQDGKENPNPTPKLIMKKQTRRTKPSKRKTKRTKTRNRKRLAKIITRRRVRRKAVKRSTKKKRPRRRR